jgi:hypothetical protein
MNLLPHSPSRQSSSVCADTGPTTCLPDSKFLFVSFLSLLSPPVSDPLLTEQCYWALFYKPPLTLSHHLLNVLLQIANKLGLEKKIHWTTHGVEVLLAADSQSTSLSAYRASLWDPCPHFILLFFLCLTITVFFFRRRLLWRENGSVVYSAITQSGYWHPITILYHIIWDCIPFLLPLTTPRN